jgi:signal transduction histidine kinase
VIILLLAVAAVASAVAVALALRLRRERDLRVRAEVRVQTMEEQKQRELAGRRRMVAVAAHELRSPVSVILGYHELIADGIYGELDERGQEALGRIRQAAEHQLRVLEGTVDLVSPGKSAGEAIAPVELGGLVHTAIEDARTFGLAYSVEIDAEPVGALPTLVTDGERVRRALDMVFAAAVKGSPGRHITFRAETSDGAALFAVGGTGLDPARDEPGGIDGLPLRIDTGAALRIAIARSFLDGAGTVRVAGLPDAVTIELRVHARPHHGGSGGTSSD